VSSSSRFFERFREETARYAVGVHRLGEPAAKAALGGVPDAELASFLASWNGAELLGDALTVLGVAVLSREGDTLWFGATGLGDRLGIQLGRGCVVRREADSDELIVEGTSFSRWLEATVVADAVIYDREGEFQEDVYDGEDLAPRAQARREKKALKVDPGAPGPSFRLARALARLGDEGGARRQLETLTAAWPDFAWAHFDLGQLRRNAGAPDAEAAFAAAAAAAARSGGEHAAFFAAHAARECAERADEAGRSRHAAYALELDADCARGLRRAAQARAEDGEPEEALELRALAAALAPRDLETVELRRRLAAAGKQR
jgi:hypothetical protein